MSHFSQLQIEYKSKSAIVQALEKLGFTVTVHESAVQLEGYQGDLRSQTAEIVVSRSNIGGASNDLGFVWVPELGAYQMLISEYDQRYGTCAPGRGLGPSFVQQFSRHYIVADLSASGTYQVTDEVQLADGTFQLVVEKVEQVQTGIGVGSVESWTI